MSNANSELLHGDPSGDDEQPKWKRLDQYYTPAPPVRFLIDRWPWLDSDRIVAEPCCGRGDICDVLEANGNRTIAGDIDPAETAHLPADETRVSRDVVRADVTLPKAQRHYETADTVVTNPPYSAETGTAGEVLESIVEWSKPTAALLPLHWQEACGDRRWAWCADNARRPAHVWILPRIEYDYPTERDKTRNPGPSMWVIWHPWHDGDRPRMDHVLPHEFEKYRGQTAMFRQEDT